MIEYRKAEEIAEKLIAHLIGKDLSYLDSMKILFCMQCAISQDNDIKKEDFLRILEFFLEMAEEEKWDEDLV